MTTLVPIRGSFREATAFRVLLAPRGLDGEILLQAEIVSWDLKVFDLDKRVGSIDAPIYTLLGQDPAGTNPDGFAFVSTSLQTGGGWSKNAVGYSFRHDLDPNVFEHAGGHRYEFVYRFATVLNGEVADVLQLRCVGDAGEL